jgi:hypothetical protein
MSLSITVARKEHCRVGRNLQRMRTNPKEAPEVHKGKAAKGMLAATESASPTLILA